MKRRRTGYHYQNQLDVGQLPSQIEFRSLESSVLLESGGDTGLPINHFSSQLSGALGQALRIQYDSTFWNKDFYTTNYNNFLCGIVVSCFSNDYQRTAIFPVLLPRQALASTANTTLTYTEFFALQKSVVYALNLLFSKSGFVLEENGTFISFSSLTIDDPTLPILQTAQLPPLLWDIIPQTGQLCLRKNPNYVDSTNPTTFSISYEVIIMQNTFQDTTQSMSPGDVSMYGPDNGWFGDGAYIFGFGNLNVNTQTFNDSYINATYPPLTKFVTDYTSYSNFCQTYLLRQTSVSCATRSLSLVATRYYKIKSTALSRLQKRPIYANSLNSDMGQVIGILYNVPDSVNIFADLTGPFAENTAPVIQLIPNMNGNSVVDLTYTDEWGNDLTPYFINSDNDVSRRAFYENTDSAITLPPVAYQVLDPYGSANAPNHDCLFPYYKINQTVVRYPVVSGTPGISLSSNTLPGGPPSMGITHFIRLIGS